MLRAASTRARINIVNTLGSSAAIQPVDGHISFPPINPTRVISLHYDALVLTLCINNFDVHGILVDSSSANDLLHLPAFQQMKVPLDRLNSARIVLSRFNGATTDGGRYCSFRQGRAGNTASIVFSGRGLGTVQCYRG